MIKEVRHPADHLGNIGLSDYYVYWDRSGELAALGRPGGNAYAFFVFYDRTGQVAGIPMGYNLWTGPSAYQRYIYDSLGRLRNIEGYDSGDTTGTADAVDIGIQAYDNNANITQMTDWRNLSQRECYKYDVTDRLTHAYTTGNDCVSADGTGADSYDHTYSYDAIGNLKSRTPVGAYTYSAGTAGPHAVTSTSGGDSFGYDGNGDMTARHLAGEPAQTLGYSYDRRLMTVTSSAGTTSFAYDVDGNRVLRDDGTTTTVYLPHGFEHSTVNTTGARTARKTTSVAGRAIGTQDSFFANPVPKWLYTNHQGSVAASYDPATGVVDRNRYDPWGAERTTAVSGTDVGYTGQRNDNSTGLMYYGARYYDPTIGRFNQTDTIVPNPAEPEDLNRYSYVRNNPVNLTDPTGNYCIVAGPRKGECVEPGDDPGDTGVPGTGDPARRTTRGSGGRGSPSGGAKPADDGCQDGCKASPDHSDRGSGPHQLWWCVQQSLLDCYGAFRDGERAIGAARELRQLRDWSPEEENAFQHAYWIGLVTRRIDAAAALALGEAHEADQSDGEADTRKDLLNNERGSFVAELLESKDDLEQLLIFDVENGYLWCLESGEVTACGG